MYCRSIIVCKQLGVAAGCGMYYSKALEDANQVAL